MDPSHVSDDISIIMFLAEAIPRTSATLFGQGTGPILFQNVACRGLESRLVDCPNDGVEASSCSHSADVGVTCLQGKYSATHTPTFRHFSHSAMICDWLGWGVGGGWSYLRPQFCVLCHQILISFVS